MNIFSTWMRLREGGVVPEEQCILVTKHLLSFMNHFVVSRDSMSSSSSSMVDPAGFLLLVKWIILRLDQVVVDKGVTYYSMLDAHMIPLGGEGSLWAPSFPVRGRQDLAVSLPLHANAQLWITPLCAFLYSTILSPSISGIPCRVTPLSSLAIQLAHTQISRRLFSTSLCHIPVFKPE